MHRTNKIFLGVLVALSSIYTPMFLHDSDSEKNNEILTDATAEMQQALLEGKRVDPVLAYKVNTMRRLNKVGAWLSEKEVKNVIKEQLLDYMMDLPDEEARRSPEQKEVYAYALKSTQDFFAKPDKARFREDLRRDLREAKNVIHRSIVKESNTL